MKKRVLIAVGLVVVLLLVMAVPAFAAWLTDPPASVSYVGTTLILHKELSGFKNYGQTDKAADVLYSGETGDWTFSSSGLPAASAVRFVMSGALDDHYSVLETDYSMKVMVNGTEVFNGYPGFVHGLPFGTTFTNWQQLEVDANGEWTIAIENTSPLAAGHWIAFDWIELHISLVVECKLVDCALAKIPSGDGVSPVTDDEVGPGGWRFNSIGKSFVTFAYTLNADSDGYDVVAGRSNVAGNIGVINNYPHTLDLPQSALDGVIMFSGKRGEIVLTGDTSNDPPLFKLPGKGEGQVRINLHDPDGDGKFEGCAKSPMLKNFGFVVPEGGDFVQIEYFKAYAEVDSSGRVTFFQWTEVSTFNNTTSGN